MTNQTEWICAMENAVLASVMELITRTWGFPSLRPMQERAITTLLQRRDSLVVLPTGGGKSLCYQAPAAYRSNEVTVVVSPLIALMKDQVDSLSEVGVSAARIDSTLTESNKRTIFEQIKAGQIRLLYCSPEKLVSSKFQEYLKKIQVKTFIIDEAHCISHWGHDFRPEYRQLAQIRRSFSEASFHAFTATATQQVREDIVNQLGLNNPVVLVGNFDRPNLTYRCLFREGDGLEQILDVLSRHKDEAGIIYCVSRKDVDKLTLSLQANGYEARRYRAKHPEETEEENKEERRATQEAFRSGECNLIVATVAFGMGVDRPDLRFVLHAGLPKSMEHYQQEAGRAGRDGLPAECVLLHSGRDVMTWKFIIEQSSKDLSQESDYPSHAMEQLNYVATYAGRAVCRHKALVEHFGQPFESTNCGACDVCLGEADLEPEATVLAQKILSCVYRAGQNYGINHIISVLRGANTERIRTQNHDKLSTYGLLKDHPEKTIKDWIFQLLAADWLEQSEGDYPVLKLNDRSWEVLKNKATVQLLRKKTRTSKKSVTERTDLPEADRPLFELLRRWRSLEARRLSLPPYTIFHDSTLQELAKKRPTKLELLSSISGIGERKQASFGPAIIDLIQSFQDNRPVDLPEIKVVRPVTGTRAEAFELFRQGKSIEEVAQQLNRATSTTLEYLCAYVETERPDRISQWVDEEMYNKVVRVLQELGPVDRLKPIFDALNGTVHYNHIRIILAHCRSGEVF